ncbi:MAG: VOC family protein [Saprospiraceae bacterium]|nr:VOC family protein [Saprospiraceae bacterium]
MENQSSEGRVTGIGGIFFKCKNPKELRAWYEENLGIKVNQYGAVFEWRQGLDSSQKGFTQWSPFNEKTKYFDPSTKEFMINFRVDNLDKLLHKLNQNHISILDTIEAFDYGKFLHIMDLEGNKIELWEPNDIAYEKLGESLKCETNK